LTTRRESLIGRLKVLLSAELDLLKMMDQERPQDLLRTSSMGTGKQSIEIDDVAQQIDNDRTTPTY
jgi:hypothetical protein